jgi:hypothetical protein
MRKLDSASWWRSGEIQRTHHLIRASSRQYRKETDCRADKSISRYNRAMIGGRDVESLGAAWLSWL